MEDWKPTLMVCMKCEDRFYSKHNGHCAWCKCGESGVDETDCYMRVIGSAKQVYSTNND